MKLTTNDHGRRATRHARGWPSEAGYSLVELMVGVVVLSLVAGTVMSGVERLTRVTETTSNRSEMHSGVRNATEFLQQEIGQAGRVAFPGTKTLSTGVGLGANTVGITSNPSSRGASGLFVGEKIIVGAGTTAETVTLTAVSASPAQITATFAKAHAAGEPVTVQGGFGTGIVPTVASGFANGSTGSLLKIYGDVRGDGDMSYVEYTCDTAGGNLYRNAMSFTAANKPALTVSQVLLNNILPNPDGTNCFTYEVKTVAGQRYVVNVAITLTVRTQDRDPITKTYQTETKALLNVAPRNVYHMWQLASQSNTTRIQPMPASVTSLLPSTSYVVAN